jgi:hypothetical protein
VKANGISGISLLLNDIQYGKISNRYYGRYKYDNGYLNKTKKTSKIPGSWFQKMKSTQITKRATLNPEL